MLHGHIINIYQTTNTFRPGFTDTLKLSQ